MQMLALMGLRNHNTVLESNRSLIKQNLTLLRDFFHYFPEQLQWCEPRGGSIAFPRLISGKFALDYGLSQKSLTHLTLQCTLTFDADLLVFDIDQQNGSTVKLHTSVTHSGLCLE